VARTAEPTEAPARAAPRKEIAMRPVLRSIVSIAGTATLAAALLAGIQTLTAPAQANNAVRAASGTVAVVDLQLLINSLEEFKAAEAKIQPELQRLQQELNSMSSNLESAKAEFDLINSEEQRINKMREIRKLTATTSFQRDINQTIINFMLGDNLRNLYNDAIQAVEQIAQREGYEIVIVDDRALVVPNNIDVREAETLISRKRILYAGDSIDITQRVIDKMNTDFRAGK
ncbi:MAG: OmpH family outer membrane protein, partial [Planctomycetota bacterium]